MSINISENGKEVPVDSFWHFVEILWSVATGLTKKSRRYRPFQTIITKNYPGIAENGKNTVFEELPILSCLKTLQKATNVGPKWTTPK